MPARLAALDHAQVILVDRPILLVGRHAECDIQLESSKISRKHCLLAVLEPYILVRDLESTNGVRINGEKVAEGKMLHGDELMIGNLRFKLEWDDPQRFTPSSLPRPVEKLGGRPVPGHPVEPVSADHLLSCEFPVPIMEGGDSHATVGPTLSSSGGKKGKKGAD